MLVPGEAGLGTVSHQHPAALNWLLTEAEVTDTVLLPVWLTSYATLNLLWFWLK